MLINEENLDQVIETIRKLHQTSIDQRLINLTEYLTELFQSIQTEQISNVFKILTSLLNNYEDRAALKIEFLKAKCLETIHQILNTNEDNTLAILQFLIELLNDSENVQEKFLEFNGYKKFFHSLRYIHSPTIEFINQLIFLMIEKSSLQPEQLQTPPVDSFVIFINPHITISLIYWIPYLKDPSQQHYILSSIDKIIIPSLPNKMMACSNGIILPLLEILNNKEENSIKFEEQILYDIFNLLENLSRFSINPKEIRYIFQLFNQNFSFKKQLLKLLVISARHNDPDTQSVSSYFDLQRANSGIILPTIRRWPSLASSTSQHFTFHCWLRLNHEIHSYPYEGRRQIYSFYSDSIGLESFIRNSSLFVLITDHRELVYVEINDCDDIIDGYWHSLTIVHTGQKSSLFSSAFQTTLTCQLTVYFDGLLRKEIKDFKYVSIINDSINFASIGSPSERPKSSILKIKTESLSTTLAKTMQPFKGLFSLKTKSSNSRKENQGFYSQYVMIIDPNSQENVFGQSTCLYGQIACVWIVAETLDESQVKHLHTMGPDFCYQNHSPISGDNSSISSTLLDYLFTRSLLCYHPLACNGQTCIDISGYSSQINGRLMNSSCLRFQPFSQSLFNLGGCPILYPLFELFQDSDYTNSDIIFSTDAPKKSVTDINNQFYSNPIASLIYLIRCVLSSTSMFVLIEQITKHFNIEILGEYLNRISPNFMDQQLLISIEQFIETSRFIDSSHVLTVQLIQHILLDFNIWNKSKFHIRLLHLQYILKVIKDEKKFDQDKFGVQFFLDILKQHFNSSKDDTDEQEQLRDAIYGIMKYFLYSHIRLKDLNPILSTISTLSVSNDIITHELLDFILGLLDPPSITTETTIECLSESNIIESLYALLVVYNLSSETKEIVFKIMKCFLQSKRVSQQIRAQLRLETNHIGFGGIISGIAFNELNQSIVEEILNLIITSHSSIAAHHLNIVLTLCSAASLDVRYIAMRKLMTYFITNPSACRLYAKCHGWQETLANFFVKIRRSSLAHILPHRSSSHEVLSSYTKNQSLDSSQDSSNLMNTNDTPLQSPLIPTFNITLNTDDSTQTTTETNLTKTYAASLQSLTSNSAATSMELLPTNKDSTDYSNDTIMTPPLSTSASREDLLSLLKTEDSNNNPTRRVRIHSDSSPLLLQTSTDTSMIQPYDDKGSYEKHKQLGCALRKFLGITSAEDPTFFIQSPLNIGDGSVLEEMCETLILAIVMILWKGITDSDDASWTVRGQIFSALRRLHREHDLYLPLDYIERRILELSMEACLNDVKLDGAHRGFDRLYRRRFSLSGGIRKQTTGYENNCRELIKLVNDFISQPIDNNERISENLVNGIIPILDTMLIFKCNDSSTQGAPVSLDDHWSETSLTGLNILLILLAHSNTLFCGQASIRIHSLLNFRPLNGCEEAAYLLSSVNKVFSSISNSEDSEPYTYLLPLMKVIIEKSFDLLRINEAPPNIPLNKETLATIDDFRQCISRINRDDWEKFIEQITEPYADHYRSMSVRPFQMNMKIWWNHCQEMMNIGIHKRNRQIEVEKSKFQNYIVKPWHQRSRLDDQRTLKLLEQRRIHQIHINHEWKNRKKYLHDERGPWFNDKNIEERRWMISNRENIHRMRCKLVENDYFDKHEDSSRLRDNLRIETITQTDENANRRESLRNEQKENSHGNSIDEQEPLDISAETQSFLSEEKEKIIIGKKCSLITSTSITDGELIITEKYIYFFDLTRLKTCQNEFKYPLIWLQDIYLRRYNLRPTALEFFLINQINFLLNFDKNPLNFDKKARRKIFLKLMSLKLPSMKSSVSNLVTTITPQEILKESKITEKWITREISNFDYLMMLNTIAGRTYNDLNQYPIFPWVLKDYTSQVLDIKNPDVFRDFSKPIGIQNPKHIEEVKFKYESFDDPTGLIKKFHYGTHYSNAASVMHYLIRMEPFTTLHIQLQSGKFDIADRQFHSFQSSWINIMDSPNDGKELIPEFFYLPEFLSNLNKFDLGKLQSSDQNLNDVLLPPWAHDSPEEFIRIHRLALESEYVSSHLHEWIDLIFGYKQTGQAAIDAFNVFMYCSYEKAIDADAIDDSVTRDAIDGMIQNFGQIPSQLLTEPHPQRQTRGQGTISVEIQGRPLNLFQNLNHIKVFFVEVTSANDKLFNPITFISIPKNQIRSFMQQGTPDTLVTINTNGVVGNNGWHPYDKSLNNLFTFERDPALQFERNRVTTTAPFSPSINATSSLFAVSHDAKYIFSGGHWDCSLRIYSLLKTKTISSNVRHTDIITCLTLDSTGYILVTGSRDATCIIWQWSFNDNRNININDQDTTSLITPEITLYGHTDEITCVGVSSELDLVVSGSLDGTCNIYTLEHGVYIRTLRPTDDSCDPIVNLKLSDERHILVQTEREDTHLFLYSINGHLIRTRKFEFHVVDMLLHDQYIILAVNYNSISEHKTELASSVAARVIIKDMFEMTTIQTIRLRTQISCLYLTKDYSHLLVAVKDGKIFVLTPEKKLVTKHVSKN